MHNKPRIYLSQALLSGRIIELTVEQRHYLFKVMRLNISAEIKVFNDRDGEYLAQLTDHINVSIIAQLQSPTISKPIAVGMCLLKPKRWNQVLEGVTQLGATHIQPLISQHCQVRELNYAKTAKQLIEAAEQSERINVPQLLPMQQLSSFFTNHTKQIIVATERSTKTLNSLASKINLQSGLTIVVGPEGGFSAAELAMIEGYTHIISVNISTQILRAETAVIVLLSQLQLLQTLTA